MPLEIAPFVTLEEVEAQLQQMKDVYGVSCEELERNPELCNEYEDAGVEWAFLIEQRNALRQLEQNNVRCVVKGRYAPSASRSRCLSGAKSVDIPLQLAA
jgi:hypothetical protein